jgi:cell pole-organizing protein PopZ
VPSVAATLGPYRKLEPLSASFRTAADDRGAYSAPSATGAPADTPRNALSRTDERRERFDRLDPTTPDTVPLSSSSASAPGETSADRAMEDAVADLLRPLLKTWLAENMPKIVERALRREITERLLPPSGKNNSD